ncbi:Uncharacterised protein [Mycobacterium tuberculosis]|nr:Uncharacterised protein [Mycobacterium tuberculosis]
MRQLAGHPLRPGLVVPQVRIRCLMLELLDAAAQTLDVEHPLHRGQGAVQGGDVGLTVGVHSSQGYRHQRLASDDRHVHRTTAAQPIRSPLRRSRAQHRRLEYASLLHRHRGLRAVGVLRRGILAEGRRHDRGPRHGRRHAGDVADSLGAGALRGRAGSPQDQVDQQAIRKDGRGPPLPLLRQCGRRRTRPARRALRALRRRDLRRRRAVRSHVEHPR